MKRLYLITAGILLYASVAGAFTFNMFNLNWSGSGGKFIDLIHILTMTPSSKAFGNITTNTTATQVFTLSNTGNYAAEDVAVTVTGAGFTEQSRTCAANPFALASNADCTVTVAFTPTATQTYNGFVNYSGPNISPVGLALSGTGTSEESGFVGQSSVVGFASDPSVSATNQGAMRSFVASASGTISYFHAHVISVGGTFNAAIYNEAGTLLADGSLTSLTQADGRIDIAFDSPITITSGSTYTLVVGSSTDAYWGSYRKALTGLTSAKYVPMTITNAMPSAVPTGGTTSTGYDYSYWADNLATGGE